MSYGWLSVPRVCEFNRGQNGKWASVLRKRVIDNAIIIIITIPKAVVLRILDVSGFESLLGDRQFEQDLIFLKATVFFFLQITFLQ